MSRRIHWTFAAFFTALALVAIGCGGGSSGGGVIAPPDNPVLADVQALVFNNRCATSSCHAGPNPEQNLDLSAGNAASNIINVEAFEAPGLMRVEPGNATDSYLYMKVIGDPRITGDQMPAEGALLSTSQRNLIRDWIDQGAN